MYEVGYNLQQFIIVLVVVIIKMYYDLIINNYIWQKMNLKIFKILLIIVKPEPDTLLQVSIRHCIMLTYNSLENIK